MDNIDPTSQSTQDKIKAAMAEYMAKPNTTDRDEEQLEWLLNEIRAGRK